MNRPGLFHIVVTSVEAVTPEDEFAEPELVLVELAPVLVELAPVLAEPESVLVETPRYLSTRALILVVVSFRSAWACWRTV